MATKLGKMRHRIILETVTETEDAGGGRSTSWCKLDEVWAHVRPLSQRELDHAQAIERPTTHQVRIRHRYDITIDTKLRVRFPATPRLGQTQRTFNVHGVINPNEANRELLLACEEAVAVG